MLRNFARAVLPTVIQDALRAQSRKSVMRSGWIDRRSSDRDHHLSDYWQSYSAPNRTAFVEILVAELKQCRSQSILDYGSHVGPTLRAFLERCPDVPCFASEPNAEAVAFLKQHLPSVSAIVADDEAFIASEFPSQNVGISYTNGVFNQMEDWRAKGVLTKMARISEIIIIGEAMGNADGAVSRFNIEPAYYLHPYKKWLTDLGFSGFSVRSVPEVRPQCDGFMVSCKSRL